MEKFFFTLKQQAHLLNLILFLIIVGFVSVKYQKRVLSRFLFGSAILVFLISSTYYLPESLTKSLESKYAPFQSETVSDKNEKVFIHVLGSGFNMDQRLPPTARLGLTALGRLTEGVRIYKTLPNSIIVCSGNSMFEKETQAEVTQQAALQLGVDSNHTVVLSTPATTLEEAEDLKKMFGTNIKLIVVTDALHMPRAISIFSNLGFHPLAAPTNYKVPLGSSSVKVKWLPTVGNIQLMDLVMHEYLGG